MITHVLDINCLYTNDGIHMETIEEVIFIPLVPLLATTLVKKNSVYTTPAYNFDSDDGSDDNLFYDAVRIAYDQSVDVRTYFRNNPSKINPKSKRLWPLRYHAFNQFGI
jgi:hypothetical protein